MTTHPRTIPQSAHPDILRRHKAQEPHTAIAEHYKVSRERIRQIVKAMGGTPRRGTLVKSV